MIAPSSAPSLRSGTISSVRTPPSSTAVAIPRAIAIGVALPHIGDVDEPLAAHQPRDRDRADLGRNAVAAARDAFCECARACSDGAEALAVIGHRIAVSGLAERVRLFQHRIEHRREIAGRGIDDLQYLGGRGLLLQRLARLGDQPRILHRDDRLRREVLQQRDLLVGERPHFVAIGGDRRRAARHPCAAAQPERSGYRRARAARRPRSSATRLLNSANIGDVDEPLARRQAAECGSRVAVARLAQHALRTPPAHRASQPARKCSPS